MKAISLILIVALVIISLGCASSRWGEHFAAEEYALIDSGNLTDFIMTDVGTTITLDNRMHVIDRNPIDIDTPLLLGEYYYLYKDAIGGSTIARPYLLTQTRLEGELSR